MSGAYAYHLIKNHPFVDGNKRVGFASANVFLLMNGLRLTYAINVEIIVGVADGTVSKEELTGYFLNNSEVFNLMPF